MTLEDDNAKPMKDGAARSRLNLADMELLCCTEQEIKEFVNGLAVNTYRTLDAALEEELARLEEYRRGVIRLRRLGRKTVIGQ